MADYDDTEISIIADQLLEKYEALVASGTKRVAAIQVCIVECVKDPCLAPSVVRRVAQVASSDHDRVDELMRLLARVLLGRQRREIRSAAGYFGSSVKRLVVHKWGEPWEAPRPIRGGPKR